MTFGDYIIFQSFMADLLGILGFVIAVITLVIANSARNAAREARESVKGYNLINELKGCQQKVAILQAIVARNDWATAHYIVQDITQISNELVAKWGHDHKGMKTLLADVDSISEIISQAIGGKLTVQGEVQVRNQIKRVLRIIAFVSARSENRIEPHLTKVPPHD